MTTIQLKKELIHRIAEIDDNTFLNVLKTIIDLKTQSKIIHLTNEQKEKIYQSKKEFENGHFTEQFELNKEFEQWLKEN